MRISDWSSDVCSSDLCDPCLEGPRTPQFSASNRVRAVDYHNFGLFDPTLPAALKRDYVGRYEIWRLFLAFNPVEYHHLIDKKLQFRSEEHTSELQSLMRISYAVFCLKKQNNIYKMIS